MLTRENKKVIIHIKEKHSEAKTLQSKLLWGGEIMAVKKIINDPRHVVDEMLEGYLSAYGRYYEACLLYTSLLHAAAGTLRISAA